MKPETAIRISRSTQSSAFSLVELLLVIAIISLLMAILLPAAMAVRSRTYRLICMNKVRQITLLYESYFVDNDGKFYQGINHNYDYGGWSANSGSASSSRPINAYIHPSGSLTEKDAEKYFKCPCDKGAFSELGNSYQANNILVCPSPLQTGPRLNPPWVRTCNQKINPELVLLKNRDNVTEPSKHLWIGDFPWYNQWDPLYKACSGTWHGRLHKHIVSFLDGHAAYVEIIKGPYITETVPQLHLKEDYRIQPFDSLDESISQYQQLVRCGCGTVGQLQ